MKTPKQRLTLLILLAGFIVALLISAELIPAQSDKATQNWAELMTGMDKMHAAMSSVERSGDSDVDFVRLMLPHHQAAIDMAKTQLLYGKDPQMRRLALEIITDQQSEIELMQLWLKQRDALTPKKAPKANSSDRGTKP
jgi:Domain of unknown function (DUF305)